MRPLRAQRRAYQNTGSGRRTTGPRARRRDGHQRARSRSTAARSARCIAAVGLRDLTHGPASELMKCTPDSRHRAVVGWRAGW
jgi:hypothetical protein